MDPSLHLSLGLEGFALANQELHLSGKDTPNTNSVSNFGFCEVQLVRGWLFVCEFWQVT